MADIYYDQSSFTQGQLDPRIQFRTDWEGRYKAAKLLENFLVIPQGGAEGRWGTVYVDTATVFTGDPLNCEISTLTYDNNAVYLLVWEHLSLKIYLERILMATVVLPYQQEYIRQLRFGQIENRIVVVNGNFRPYQLVRSANAANLITGTDLPNNGLTITNALTVGTVYPATFTTAVSLPVTNPQIYTGVTYFIKPYAANSINIFSTASDAASDTNAYTVSTAGVGANNVIVQNTWSFNPIDFVYVPTFDFTGGYSAITFTPSATSGNITLTASANIFTAAMVGGVFIGNGGIMRITVFTDATHVDGFTLENFANTNAILGALATLTEPAWSATRGWPRAVGFYQDRSVFAGSPSIPNGVWLSVVNEVYNMDDSQTLDDDAISRYPSSGQGDYIYAITSSRNLIIHKNTGNWATPFDASTPVTPKNFNLIEQNKFGIADIQPIFIDNQIMFVDSSGNNVINMVVGDITQNSFTTNNISVESSNLIIRPTDMAAFAQPNATDGFYALFVNNDGTLASYQTLIEEGIGAWSPMNTKTQIVNDQDNGFDSFNSKFIRVTTANGRCWFTVQRRVPVAQAAVNIVGFNANNATLQANGHGMTVGQPTLATLTAVVPTTNPQIVTTKYYFAVATNANNFRLYLTKADATNDANRIAISSAGVGSTVVSWPVQNKLYIEELSFGINQDSGKTVTLSPASATITGLAHLNGQVVSVKGDNYVLNNRTVVGGSITVEQTVSSADIGLPFVPKLIPLPICFPGTPGSLFKQKHIKTIYVSYYFTVGATIQGTVIPVQTMQEVVVGEAVVPKSGVFVFTPFEGWDAFEAEIVIEQPLPLPITILALSYVIGV